VIEFLKFFSSKRRRERGLMLVVDREKKVEERWEWGWYG